MNAILKEPVGEGFEFLDQVLDDLDFSYRVVGREIERIPPEGPLLLLVNRPLGLAECAAVVKLLREVRRDVRVVANDCLGSVIPLRPVLVASEAVGAALQRHEALIAWGPLSVQQRVKAVLQPVDIGARPWARFYGLAAFFRRGATLPVRIGHPIACEDLAALDLHTAQRPRRVITGGKLLGFKREVPIARPEDRLLLRRELQAAPLLGHVGDGKKIVLFDAKPDSSVLRELGRLREVAFRQAGEGTGKRKDVDSFDAYYRHLVLWDDAELQIAGAYRIGEVAKILKERGPEGLYTNELFSYGEALRPYLPRALELGRSFVQPRYQSTRALEYLWQGIGAYLFARPQVRYLFGAVSLSAAYAEAARHMVVGFFAQHYGTDDPWAEARFPYRVPPGDYPRDLRALKERLSSMGVSVPVLYRQYAELCEPGGTRFLAFNVDAAFSNCVDALVLIDLDRLKPQKRQRYIRRSAVSGCGRATDKASPAPIKTSQQSYA